mgnify:CR=1 FL=1
MNRSTVITLIIICLVSAYIMPTLEHRWIELDNQATERITRLKAMGRM